MRGLSWWWSARVALLGVLAIAGCSPQLAGDGYYHCARGGCPQELPHCYPNSMGQLACHSRPPMDGGDAGPGADAGGTPGGFDYPPCMPGRACSGGAVCVSDGSGSGYCAPPCDASEGCPAFAGLPSYCEGGSCRRGCNASSGCPTTSACLSGRWTDGEGVACTEDALASPAELYDACGSDAECPVPLACVNGACVRNCDPALDPATCRSDEVCQNAPRPPSGPVEAVCLVPCTAESPGVCPPETVCREAGMGSGLYRCLPMAWPMMP